MRPDAFSPEMLQVVFGAQFRSADPYGQPLQPSVEGALLVFSTAGSVLTESQFAALSRGATLLGERRAIVALVDQSDRATIIADPIYSVELDRYETYVNDSENRAYYYVENAVVSLRGRWGVLVSDESHAIVAGSRRFVETVGESLDEDEESMVRAFLRFWRDMAAHGMDARWVPDHLRHVLGSERAEELLRADCDET